MSRIQNVLEKAEREGAVRRMRVVAEPIEVAALETAPPAAAAPSSAPEPTDAGGAFPGRVIRGAQLHPRLLASAAVDGTAAEQYRALRTRIVHADNGAAVNVVLVTSPATGDGKSLTVANLGLAMAQEYQRRICIVDANLRHPQLHRLFDIPEEPGLADVLMGHVAIDEAIVAIEEHHISVLPAGTVPAHPAELLGTTTMRRTIETLRSRFDCVVIDAPAASPLADVGILTPLVDSILLIVRAGVTSKPAIHDAIAALDAGRLLGVVLNDAAA